MVGIPSLSEFPPHLIRKISRWKWHTDAQANHIQWGSYTKEQTSGWRCQQQDVHCGKEPQKLFYQNCK